MLLWGSCKLRLPRSFSKARQRNGFVEDLNRLPAVFRWFSIYIYIECMWYFYHIYMYYLACIFLDLFFSAVFFIGSRVVGS